MIIVCDGNELMLIRTKLLSLMPWIRHKKAKIAKDALTERPSLSFYCNTF